MDARQPTTETSLPLSERHRSMLLVDSAISEDAVRATGYRTVTDPADLLALGFSKAQARVPGLLVPIHGPGGGVVSHQFRPDEPRLVHGKPVKYETPKGAPNRLHCPPVARAEVRDPRRPLLITEGVRKADAAASFGFACVALAGVWNWKTKGADGATLPLGDWDEVPLRGRDVCIVYDSDASRKDQVRQAERRLAAWLESRGARVRVARIPDPADGGKDGLDDFLAKGGDLRGLLEAAEPAGGQPPAAACPYVADEGGTWWLKSAADGVQRVRLADFSARIVGQIRRTDGEEESLELELELERRGARRRLNIPAAELARPADWALRALGAGAVVMPGSGTADRLRCAIQMLSGDVPERTVYAATGWHDGRFVLAGGGIGPDGLDPGVGTDLPACLRGYAAREPAHGRELERGVRAAFCLLDCAPDRVSAPLVACLLAAPLGGADFALWMAAPKESRKSSLCAAGLNLYGGGFASTNLPASWSSTDNALEELAFLAKDLPLVVDDWVADRGRAVRDQMNRRASRILRAQGNRSGRGRMTSDLRHRPVRPPRGLLISTAESVPQGMASELARTFLVEFDRGDVDNGALGRAQEAAGDLHGCGMAWLRWLAEPGRLGELRSAMEQAVREARCGSRAAEQAARMECALTAFARFAEEAGVPSGDWLRRALGGVREARLRQDDAKSESDPVRLFLDELRDGLEAKAAFLRAAGKEERPFDGESWGWPAFGEPRGEFLGWVDAERGLALLHFGTAFGFVAKRLEARGRGLGVDERALRRMLIGQGLAEAPTPGRSTVVRRIGEERKTARGFALRLSALEPEDAPAEGGLDYDPFEEEDDDAA